MSPIAATLRGHFRSVFARGPGYEAIPTGSHYQDSDLFGYYIDFSEKTSAVTAASPTLLVPADLAQLALGWFERSLAGDDRADAEFRKTCELLETSSVQSGGARLWLYHVPVGKFRLRAPWISALSQAQAASVFARAFHRYGEERYAQLSVEAIAPLLRGGPPSVRIELEAGPAFEEAPTQRPSVVLNGWIFALWGLRDVAEILELASVRHALEDSTGCLIQTLSRFDVGWWTLYSLYPFRMVDLAKPFYHRLHVEQLEVLANLTGDRAFADTAERWRSYDRPTSRVRALAQKAAFVGTGYQQASPSTAPSGLHVNRRTRS